MSISEVATSGTATTAKTAYRINFIQDNGVSLQRLYRLSDPVEYETLDEIKKLTQYVIVSAADVTITGYETYIFPANENGEILDWTELPGSFQGALDHEEALRRAGYQVKAWRE